MTVHTLPLGWLQANCYIVANGSRCILIDPGDEASKVLAFLEEKDLKPDAILLTHGHFDHVGAAREVAAQTGCGIWIHSSDVPLGKAPTDIFPLGHDRTLRFWADAEEFDFAGLSIRILETPGHTVGSVCILIGDAMFSGDTLFSGSIGRTDLEGGDMPLMRGSLLRIKELTQNYTVYPGHGPSTTLDREKRVNPFLR